MEITVMTSLLAEGDVEIDTSHSAKIREIVSFLESTSQEAIFQIASFLSFNMGKKERLSNEMIGKKTLLDFTNCQ